MSLNKQQLFDFLEEVEKELQKKIILVAAGGTAMTLLNAKPSTIDVDFTIPAKYFDEFKRALELTPHGFKVDFWHDGAVFITMLPDDYLKRSKPIRTKLKNIDLRALHPVDVVVTKISRLDDRDVEDIESCIKKFRLKKEEIKKRVKQIDYPANEESFQINLQRVIKEFFPV